MQKKEERTTIRFCKNDRLYLSSLTKRIGAKNVSETIRLLIKFAISRIEKTDREEPTIGIEEEIVDIFSEYEDEGAKMAFLDRRKRRI